VGKFYPPHVGGIETHLEVLAGELCKKVDLRVMVASDSHKDVRETVDGVRVSRVATWLTAASAPICPGMIREFWHADADIVHLHFPNPMAVLAYLASRCRARLVVTYHSDAVRQKILGFVSARCANGAMLPLGHN
jgi:rhamnosyl/mannosyltransferase